MSVNLTKQIMQVALDVSKRRNCLAGASTTESLKFARNSALRIEVTLLQNNTVVDISQLSAATMEIKQTSAANGTLAVTKNASINYTLTQIQFATKEPGMCHLSFDLTANEVADSVFGTLSATDEAQHWAVFYGLINAERVVLGCGILISFPAGVTGAVVSPPAGQTIPSLEQIQALLANYVSFNVPAGKVIRFLLDDGNALQIGATKDASGNPVKIMDWENQ